MDSGFYTIGKSWNGDELPANEKAFVSVDWLEAGDLRIAIDAPFSNDPKPECKKVSCWELWNYEVVELFLVGAGDPTPYTEIEISPWGNHLVLQLVGERNPVTTELPLELRSVSRVEGRWTAEAVLSASLIPDEDLRVNAYRISGVEPDRQYHVMTAMQSEQPDFHLIDQFDQVLRRARKR